MDMTFSVPHMSWAFKRHCLQALLIMTLCFVSVAQAHPHHWIDVFAEWQFDTNGTISGVKLRWLFDDYYSVLLLDDAAATGEELQEILNKVLSNTAQHHYFIQIERKRQRISLIATFGPYMTKPHAHPCTWGFTGIRTG